MAIITISRQIGSLGDEIAKATAEKLEYKLIEKSNISKALSSLGFSLSDFDKYDEKKPTVWQTLSAQKRLFGHFIRAAVYELATSNNVVIVGRGGQLVLKDVPGVLHVRVIAPYATRVSRIMEQEECEEKSAERIIRQNDLDSSGYLSTYFDTSGDDSKLYDLVINTRAMKLSKCVELITCAVDGNRIRESFQISETLSDLTLSHKGKAALLKISRELEWVNMEVEKGGATLSGIVHSPALKNDCEKTVFNIQGIKSLDNQIRIRGINLHIS